MAQVLSQAQIDALLTPGGSPAAGHSAPDGAASGRTPIVYDFKHPNRVSKDQIRTLENIHTTFAGNLGSALTAMLRSVVDVDLLSVSQITYSEFIMTLVWPSSTYKFTMSPLEGQCLMDFAPMLGFAFVDRMFGGKGKALEATRELTGIERRVLDTIAARGLKGLASAWKRIIEVEVVSAGFETTPQFIQIVPPGSTVITTALKLKLLELEGTVTLCYPYMTLEPILEKLSGQNWIDASKPHDNAEDRALIEANLNSVAGPVSAVLATTDITMRDFLNVGQGDVIVTDTRVGEPARIFVGGVQKFTGRPGMRGRHRAIQIEALTREPQV